MIKDSNKAIYCNHSYGPYFGNGDMIAIQVLTIECMCLCTCEATTCAFFKKDAV